MKDEGAEASHASSGAMILGNDDLAAKKWS